MSELNPYAPPNVENTAPPPSLGSVGFGWRELMLGLLLAVLVIVMFPSAMVAATIVALWTHETLVGLPPSLHDSAVVVAGFASFMMTVGSFALAIRALAGQIVSAPKGREFEVETDEP
jgi:hypothetical protein